MLKFYTTNTKKSDTMNSSRLIPIINVFIMMIIGAMGILDGSPAYDNQFIYQAAILTWCKRYLCSGAIISNQHILTAASCVHGKSRSELFIGVGKRNLEDPDMTLRQVAIINIHDEYLHTASTPNSTTHVQYDGYDIAVLTIHPRLEFDDAVGRVLLPFRDFTACDVGKVAGWGEKVPGEEYHRRLLWTFQTALVPNLCAEIETYHCEDQLCTVTLPGYGKPSHGDNGAPLVIDGVIVGIADLTAEDDANGTRFTKVLAHLDFITDILGI